MFEYDVIVEFDEPHRDPYSPKYCSLSTASKCHNAYTLFIVDLSVLSFFRRAFQSAPRIGIDSNLRSGGSRALINSSVTISEMAE